MLSALLNTLALAAVASAAPSDHRRGHSHVKREAQDLSKVNWANINWAAIFGTPTTTSIASAAAATTPAATTAAAQAATSATPAAAATSSAASTGGKKGLAWAQENAASTFSLYDSCNDNWMWNWGLTNSISTSLEFVPMVKALGDVSSLAGIANGQKILGFNEPDQNGIDAGAAAASYLEYFTPLRSSGKISALGTPAITNSQTAQSWLDSFMGSCSDCKIDFIAVHYYGPTLALLQEQMGAIHAAFPSYPIWITEIGCTNWDAATNPSAAEVSQFMTDAIAWLDSTSWIARYSFFGSLEITDTSLGVDLSFQSGNSLTTLGQQYCAA